MLAATQPRGVQLLSGQAIARPETAQSSAASRSVWAGLDWRLFALSLLFNLVLATAFFLHYKYLFVDSVARTMHAFYVLWGHDAPHLAAVGFIWMPLPTMAQLPFVAWKPLALSGLAGGIMSALSTAITVAILDSTLRTLQVGYLGRISLLAVFQLQPMVLMYAANGMSEAMLVSTIVMCCCFFLRWATYGETSDLIWLSIAAAAAFMTRYEGVAVIGAGLLGIWLINRQKRASRARMGGEMLAYIATPAYSAILWLFFNWTIMGDPLHFYRGAYSNLAQIAFMPEHVRAIAHNPVLTSIYVGQRILQMAPLYIPLTLALGALSLVRRDFVAIGTSLFPFALLAFGWLNHLQGQSYGWFRFFIYAVPGVVIWIGLLYRPQLMPLAWKQALVPVLISSAALANLVAAVAMADPIVGREEFPAVQSIIQGRAVDDSTAIERSVVEYLRTHVDGREVLLDDFSGLEMIRQAGGTDMFVAGVDPDFLATLSDPAARVRYILVPNPAGLGALDAINGRYPTMFNDGTRFTELERDFGQWRLYRVVAPDKTGSRNDPTTPATLRSEYAG